MSEYEKNLIAEVFHISDNENNEYIIIIATEAYRMRNDNPDIKLVVQ